MKKGFTLVETLVAISILMIAVAGPLTVANKGLNSALYSKNQMIASFLAQESLETIKFIRDTNMKTDKSGSTWLNNIDTCPGTTCDISGLELVKNVDVSSYRMSCSASGCPIYKMAEGYTFITGEETPFSRKYSLKDPIGGGVCTSSSGQCIVTVSVTWKERLIPYEIKLSSLMTQKL